MCCWLPRRQAQRGWSTSPAHRPVPTAYPSARARICARASRPGPGSRACRCARSPSGIPAGISGPRRSGAPTRRGHRG
jgi:hypothetical protein